MYSTFVPATYHAACKLRSGCSEGNGESTRDAWGRIPSSRNLLVTSVFGKLTYGNLNEYFRFIVCFCGELWTNLEGEIDILKYVYHSMSEVFSILRF